MPNFHERRMTGSAGRVQRWLTVTLASAALLAGPASTERHAHAGQARELAAGTAPLWEVGIAGGGVHGADYPAADERSARGSVFHTSSIGATIVRLGDGGIVMLAMPAIVRLPVGCIL